MSDLSIPKPSGTGVILVTGAAGFLGHAVAMAFAQAGWRVWAQDALGIRDSRPFELGVFGSVNRKRLAWTAAQSGLRPELVFHAAGGSSVNASVADPQTDFERTVGSVREMLAFLREHAPAARLIYPSSAAVYGAASSDALGESAAIRPISPYGRHKVQAEAEIAEAGLDAVILRYFSLYGPGLRKQLLWDLARRLTTKPAQLELSGTGEERRDFLYVDDAVRLVGLAAGHDSQDRPLVLNGGRGEAITVRQAAEALAHTFGSESRIGFSGEVRAGDPAALVADVSLARTIGFEPQITFEDGARRFARWFESLPA